MKRMSVAAFVGALALGSAVLAAEQKPAADPAQPSAATGGVSQGSASLMLASLIAPYSPDLDAKRRVALAALGDNGASIFETIELKASEVSCRTSNVSIGVYGCDVKFANGTSTALKGRRAHELYATLLENGVQADGAAGSLNTRVKDLKCVIEPRILAQNAGGGAYCGWTAP